MLKLDLQTRLTLCVARFRTLCSSVRYFRELVATPDGGTLAIDLLTGLRRTQQSTSPDTRGWTTLLRSGMIAGASEFEGDTLFGREPPPLERERPMLLLASGLGGGSQDSYVRSMAATAAVSAPFF